MSARKNSNTSDELATLMNGNLLGSVEKVASDVQTINQAIEHLSDAADIFDSIGYVNASEKLTSMLEKFANKKHENNDCVYCKGKGYRGSLGDVCSHCEGSGLGESFEEKNYNEQYVDQEDEG